VLGKKIYSISKRLRLTVYKSNKNIYAQIIDDFIPVEGSSMGLYRSATLVTSSTLDPEISQNTKTNKCNKSYAVKVSNLLVSRAKSIGVVEVVFDRGGNKYHGILKAFAESARDGGLKF